MQTIDRKGSRLSPQQSRMWHWLQEKRGESVQYALQIHGNFEVGAFWKALQYIVNRNEILCTTFTRIPGMELPVQVIGKQGKVFSLCINMEQLQPFEQKVSLETHWQELLQWPFDLEQGPLLRAVLLRLAPQSHILLLQLHLLCADAATLKQLALTTFQAYAALLQPGEESQEEDALQYVNVTAWQDELLQEPEAEEQIASWHRFDLSALRNMPLPFKRSEDGRLRQWQPHQRNIVLSATLQHQLQNASVRFTVSPEAILLATWQTLLWRLTTEQDILVGILCDGRPYEELTDLIGPYSRIVPLASPALEHVNFSSVIQLVQQMYQRALDGQLYFRREAMSFHEEEVFFFPVTFAAESWPCSVADLPGFQVFPFFSGVPENISSSGPLEGNEAPGSLTVSLLCQEGWLEPFQLHLQARQAGTVFQLQLVYNASLFSERQAEYLNGLYTQLLKSALAQPEAPLYSLSLLRLEQEEEQEQRLRGAQRDWPFVPLHERFFAQAQRTPSAPALRVGEQELSYAQLAAQVERLAACLHGYALPPGSPVALLLPRCAQALISLLAVLSVGAAYVPLEAEQPPARLQRLLDTLQPTLLLTTPELRPSLPALDCPVLTLPTLTEAEATVVAVPSPVWVGPDDLASIIFTSGSTGHPKGVRIRQQSISTYTQALCELLEVETGWHFATVSSLAADLGNSSIFASLASGGCLHVLDGAMVTDAAAMQRYGERFPLDVLKIVPSHLRALLQAGARALLPRQRLLLGGEALGWDVLEAVRAGQAGCRLYNHYGPTEATVGCLVAPLGEAGALDLPPVEERGSSVPLGGPLANMWVTVRDRWQQVVPVGVVGELYVGGAGLAAGYVGRQGEEEEGFGWWERAGERGRWYRTGDWVRVREDGQVEYVGRRDGQVKVRGYRVELGEIEAVLREHGEVRDAVVQVWATEGGEGRLVGYVVGWQAVGPERGELERYLEERVPGYMVPRRWVRLEGMPLTSNGKVARRRLPEPEEREEEGEEAREGARGPVEEVVMGVWEEVLQRRGLGREENFFRLGGHSLLGTRLIARLQKAFGVVVPINWLFAAPTVAQLSVRITGLLSGQDQAELVHIEPISRSENLPLSFAQQRLWFLYQLEPDSAAYNVPVAWWLRGTLVARALEQSVQEVVNRHEVLRTTFATHEGQPVQVIHPVSRVAVVWIDLSALPEAACAQEIRRLVEQEACRPFNLAQGPLLRTTLVRTTAREHVLLHTAHHIISDAWSGPIWRQEIGTLYNAFLAGKNSPLVPLPIQYADFAFWQRQWLQGDALQAQLAYWTHQLEGSVALDLPTDRPRPPVQTFYGASQSLMLPASLSAALKQLAQKRDVTLFMLLLAAFQVLLARTSGQQDIAVGTPIANRSRDEVADLIGFFTNTLVLRSNFANNPTFEEVLQQVREVALGAYGHQDVPFEKLVELLQPERDLSRSPLFQVMFILQHAYQTGETFSQLTFKSVQQAHTTAKFDLTLAILDTGSELRSNIEYNTDLFEKDTIILFLQRWHALLETLIDNPEQRVNDVSLLTQTEYHLMLDVWNAAGDVSSSYRCLHEFFAEQTSRTPDVIAVVYADEHLTYRVLNQQANQLAHYLRRLGIGQNVPVGLCVERSLKMVIGLLGILKAGGAYVPLDPAYPHERLEFMLTEASVPVLLIQPHLAALFTTKQRTAVDLEHEWERITCESPHDPGVDAHAEQLLYIIFTSGSTGRPKGVAMPHRALSNLIEWQAAHLNLSQHARTLQFSSLSFDVFCEEVFSTWYAGGTLQLISQEMQKDAEMLARFLVTNAVERTFLPFSALLHLAEAFALSQQTPHHLRAVISTAEPLQVNQAIRTFFARVPACQLFNQYGPSESHVVTNLTLVEGPQTWPMLPSIGVPISHTQIYLLDAGFHLAPVGVPGELYIGGVNLAWGYFNRPDLTAERFIPDPFARTPGKRLYRAGDLARYLRDGTIQFLGRIDDQVKVRGYRIELGEIEAALSTHPAVSAVAVGVQEVKAGDKRLVAYVVRKGEHHLSLKELRNYVGERLPEYMLPSGLVELDRLPLSPSGKINRRQLPAFNAEMQGEGERESSVEPRGEMEELVLQCWRRVLQNEQMGVQDNFFEVGGHSLLATQVVARLRRLLHIEIPLRTLFELPTVAGLAAWVTEELRKNQGVEMPAIVPTSRDQHLPLSFAQQRLWFLDQLEPGSSAYIIPGAVRLHGQVNRAALGGALTALSQRHENLRTTFPSHEGVPFQQIASTPAIQCTVLDLSHLTQQVREATAQRLAQQEAEQPFDLARGPLLRCWLLVLSEQDQVLLLTMHHIISDGWSVGILVRELLCLYTALFRREPAKLANLPIQYADYALWQRSWLQGEVLQRQLDYWKQRLNGLLPLELPTDYSRPPVQTFRGARQHLLLSAELSQQLRALSRQEGVTLFMALLTSFQVLLARYSGQSDIAVGTPIANRTCEEVEGLIGFFVNTLVIRTDLASDPTFVELLARVRQIALEAYAHQDLPFEQIVEALQPQRDLSRSPLFQVTLVMQNLPEVATAQAPIRTEGLLLEQHTAKFELSVVVVERKSRLSISLGYNTDLFASSTIEQLLSHWQVLLERIVASPEQQLSRISLLTPAEHQRMLCEWNSAPFVAPEPLYLHELFEAQVGRTPNAVALVQDGEQLTYSVLNQRANQLARVLQHLGSGPETRTAICLERSPELLIGILAILKTGGAYVPLDITLPRVRFSRILREVTPRLLLTTATLRSQMPATAARVLLVDQVIASLPAELVPNLQVQMSPDNLAYIMYTSGSTGQPKGILSTHRGVANYLNYLAQTYHLQGGLVVLQLASITFDASVRDIFGALTTGARLVLLRPAEAKEPTAILQHIQLHGVTTLLSVVPSLLRLLLDSAQELRSNTPALQLILASGEPLFLADCRKVARVLSPGARVVNQYGPTECTMTSTYYAPDPGEEERESVLVGKPIPGMQAYILDRALQPVPPGIQGEVYLSGPGLARGYLNQAEATAERFLPHPWSTTPGACLYRTGDLARYLSDGTIALQGRGDQQVKIRGNRVELGEIEAALSWHPLVKQSVILLQQAENQEQQIIAYVVLEGGEDASVIPGELRSFLQERLPDYMLPAHFIVLERFPLTGTNKVDRQALASLSLNIEPTRFISPRDELEAQLCQIWEELLGIRSVSVLDNFFELGGHSILAVRLVSHIKRLFAQDLPLAAVFQHQTLAALASLLRRQLPQQPPSLLVSLQPQGERMPFFCVHPSGGGIYPYRNLALYAGTTRPFYGIQMPDPLDCPPAFRTLETIATYYLDAIQAIQSTGPYQIGGWSAGGVFAYEMAQQLQKQGHEVSLLALFDTRLHADDPDPEEDGLDDAALVSYALRRYQLSLPERYTEPSQQFLYVSEQLKQLEVIPHDFGIEQIRLLARVQKTIRRVVQRYTPQPFAGQITLFRASDTARHTEEAQSEEVQADDAIVGAWERLALHGLKLHHVPGSHLTMIEEPHVKDLAALLRQHLA